MKELLLFITGVALFLFGMLKLALSMQTAFSSRIRQYIRFSVKRPVFGVIVGLLSTITFQSSSATTLLTIGLVSAGLVSFFHSLGVILGADIGTTLTIQLIVWKITAISPVLLFAGIMTYFFGKGRAKIIGEAMLYFGMIFYGLSIITDATATLKENELFVSFFRETKNPLVGFFVGLVLAAVVHASAIPIGILVVLSQHGLITIEGALPILLGANVGTTATALLGSMVSNINGKRSAVAHLIFKCAGALICFLIFPFFVVFLKYLSSSAAQQIALSHFFVNLMITVVFIFLLRPFSNFIKKIMPGKEETLVRWPEFLEPKCLASPEKALACVKKELLREIALAQKMLREALSLVHTYLDSKKQDITYIELVVDNLQDEITKYLWHISCGDISAALTKKLFAFSSFTSDIERVGDHSTNIAELAESKHRRHAFFSEAGKEELRDIGGLVLENLADAASLIERKDLTKIRAVFERERLVDIKIKNAIQKHLERFYEKVCHAEAGPMFVDILVNLERISDHCRIMAQLVDGLDDEPASPRK
ncbi:MAG TPA: Na/Pi cotransporter family protein [Syntrophorhabdaceae bacterium]|nr:Na/Pi cotransporter family protein [Syntrophorhabdaceae bacterium]